MTKKRKTIIVLSVLSIGFIIWNFGLINKYNFFTAKIDILINNPKLVTIGLPLLTDKESSEITQKYGFENINYGCIINQTELKGIEIYNSEINDYLDIRNGKDWNERYKQEIDSINILKTIPQTAFWIQKNEKGNWFNMDWIHNHKNKAIISIYDKTGNLIKKTKFFMVCPGDVEWIENLEKKIDFYDGNNIKLKNSKCYLMERKTKYNNAYN